MNDVPRSSSARSLIKLLSPTRLPFSSQFIASCRPSTQTGNIRQIWYICMPAHPHCYLPERNGEWLANKRKIADDIRGTQEKLKDEKKKSFIDVERFVYILLFLVTAFSSRKPSQRPEIKRRRLESSNLVDKSIDKERERKKFMARFALFDLSETENVGNCFFGFGDIWRIERFFPRLLCFPSVAMN